MKNIKRALIPAISVLSVLMIMTILSPGTGRTSENQHAPALTIDTIMKGEEFIGTSPSGVQWSFDGKRLYFRWKKPEDKAADFYALDPAAPAPVKTTREDMLKRPPLSRPEFSRFSEFFAGRRGMEVRYDNDHRRAVVAEDGDILLIDLKTGRSAKLTSTDARETSARFSFDQKKIVYAADDNLFLLSLENKGLRQMTSFTREQPPDEKTPDEIAAWYQKQQQEIFQEFQRSGERRGRREMPFTPPSGPRRKPYFLAEKVSLSSLEITPDESRVLFVVIESEPNAGNTIVPQYVTRSGYTETLSSHTKAAYESVRSAKIGLMSTADGEVKWIDLGLGERQAVPGFVSWSPDGKTCLLTARSVDRKDHWLLLLDPAAAKVSPIEQVRDDAWVGSLGLTGIFWWPDGLHVSYISEKEGYARLYQASVDGRTKKALTGGKFEVSDAWLSGDGRTIYLESNEAHPGETHLYRMPADGGERTRITSLEGRNDIFLSPDEKTIAMLSSSTNTPPELYLQPNVPGAPAKRITLSTTEPFRAHGWRAPEVVSFKGADGVDVYARLYKPHDFPSQGPAVIFIHGAGYLQNAHKGWSSYSREYMFHNFLMVHGYIVLDADYRGSAGYGRDFRTGIYRHMGGKDLDDIIAGAKYLIERHGVGPNRIGLYGGSYGGFLTLMGMFTAADHFRAGAALRPVTDWAHYHPRYTVDILNLPQKDPEAYKKSSPIYFAEGLKGALLICHGMADTNVHFQDTVRLVQRLIELGKEGWEVAIYPVEDHSFQNSSSWADEYKRIFGLFEKSLK